MRTKVAAWDGELRLLLLSAAATTCLYGVLVAFGVFPSVLGVFGGSSADVPSVRMASTPVHRHHHSAAKRNKRDAHVASPVPPRRGPLRAKPLRAKVGAVVHTPTTPAGSQPVPPRPNPPTTTPVATPTAPTTQPAAAPPAAPTPPTPVSTTVTLTTLPAPTPTPPPPPPTVVQAPPPPPPAPPLISLPPLPLPQLPLQLPGQ